jgi:hypothetical protein
MKIMACFLPLMLCAGSLAQSAAPAQPSTDEVLVACIPKAQTPETLTLAALSAAQKLTAVTPLGDQPFLYVLVYDGSGSMGRELGPREVALARALLHTVVRSSKDTGGLVFFDAQATDFRGASLHPEELLQVVAQQMTGGGTALYDALIRATDKLPEIDADPATPRFLFVISDGGDNQSRHTSEESIKAALAARAHVIAMLPAGPGSEKGSRFLRRLTEATGGLLIEVSARKDEASILTQNAKAFDELARLFHSWWRVQMDAPNSPTRLRMKSTAACRLTAPEVIVPRR